MIIKRGIFLVMFLVIIFSLSFISSAESISNEKEVSFKYILDGKEDVINFIVYKDVVDYLGDLSPSIISNGNETPSIIDFKLKHLDDEVQKSFLIPLVDKIRQKSNNPLEQFRIAVSLVQNIEYGEKQEEVVLNSEQRTGYSRYPYEVLYDNQGICGEKSELMVFLLKELGYSTGIFRYAEENHEAVAVSCPKKNSIDNTGYCFVETTGPSIITDDSIVYVGDVKLESEPIVYELYGGNDLDNNLFEYRDAKTMKKLREGKFVFFRNWRLNRLSERYGLVEEYNLE